MESIIEALKETPWWVYVIFVLIIRVGVKALKSQTVSIAKMTILPLIFLALSITRLMEKYQSQQDIVTWALLFGMGFLIGHSFVKTWKIKADKKNWLLHLPGSRLVLILVLSIFAVKYFFGYLETTTARDIPLVRVADIGTTGLITGIFLGRFSAFLKKFFKAKHENLKK